MNREQDGKRADVGFVVVMGDAANVSNDDTIAGVGWVQDKCQRRDAHGCAIPGRAVAASADQRPMGSGGETLHGLQSAGADSGDTFLLKPPEKMSREVFGIDGTTFDERFARGESELRVVRQDGAVRNREPDRSGSAFKGTAPSVAKSAAENAAEDAIA